MKKLRKKLIREKVVIVIYQKLLVDINTQEILDYLKNDNTIVKDEGEMDYALMMINDIIDNMEEYKEIIGSHLKKGWTVERLSKMELAICLVACNELLKSDQSKEVIINEAVVLAKQYCDDDSYKFINGVLNNIENGK